MNGLITLTTDFGTQDGYVGAMKGALLTEHPAARLLDITHDVPPQDVLAGAFALAQAAPFFPTGTVHVAVVDPGVGSDRRALIVALGGSLFVAPDNGLCSLVAPADRGEAWAIDRLPGDWPLHPTFHGRDLFARVAARLAAGASIGDFSTGRVEPVRIALPACERGGDVLIGEVIHVDRFGNLITNLPPGGEEGGFTAVEIGGVRAPRARTYADVESGRVVAYVGSAGWLEVGVRGGSATALLAAGRGARVRAHTK